MKRIMIIEDNENYSRVLQHYLKHEGYNIEICSTGHEAISKLSQEITIDIIILDLKLPDTSGIDLLGEIRKYCDVPVIINSAYPQFKQDFSSWLADAYLVKGGDMVELKTKIDEVLGYQIR